MFYAKEKKKRNKIDLWFNNKSLLVMYANKECMCCVDMYDA